MSKQSLHSDVDEILLGLDKVDKETDRENRAWLYKTLAEFYYGRMAMYSRAIEMYTKSLEAHDDGPDSQEVRGKLAELLIHLYGKDGFDNARALARAMDLCIERRGPANVPPEVLDDYGSLQQRLIEWEIKHKQAAIERREQKATFDRDHPALKAIVGESHSILEICRKILAYAKSSAPVLITGDSGTGKEEVAKTLAKVSKRNFNPFNCGAMAEGVLENDLFGHVKGAFTGATTDQHGLFEMGDAVIFLDEIGDTSPKFQVDLLRVIDNREFYRVGDPRTLRKLAASTKIVCATAKNLTEELAAGRFRNDLFQRIQGLTIHCEPLAKRPEDVQLLVRHFLATEPDLQEYGPFSESEIDHWRTRVCPVDTLDKRWPRGTGTLPQEGNIRELRERVRRVVLEGKFPQKGDRPFEDHWGAMTYTQEEIERSDWTFALEVCRSQKDAGRLMGKDAKATSKTLQRLGLSKKQRKRQGPQA